MGQFKPMVKMETTEPSVILKLKKGGHVAAHKDADGHTNMKGASFKAKYAEEAAEGESPKKPSMSDRRKAMSGSMLNSKKGGKAVKKAMGGMMGAPAMAAPMAAPAAPMDPRKAAMLKAMMARKAMGAPAAPMAAPAAPGMPAMKKGGKASDKSQDKAMIMKAFKEHDAQEHKGGKGTKLKLSTGGLTNPMKKGGKVSGAAIDAAETKTTIEGNAGKFEKTKMESKKTDPGYERYAAGGTIEGNEGKFAKTKMESKKTDPGYQRYATGGVVNGMATGGLTNPMKKGGSVDWENRPANTADHFDPAYGTGGVRDGNAGGYKKGGATKKHFATGGAVDTGRAVAMPKHFVSQPVSNTRQSGTFKKGGKVVHKAAGGMEFSPDQDMGNVTPEDVKYGKQRAQQSSAIDKLLGRASTAGAGRGVVNPPLVRKQGGRA